jgi:hypothetical protein
MREAERKVDRWWQIQIGTLPPDTATTVLLLCLGADIIDYVVLGNGFAGSDYLVLILPVVVLNDLFESFSLPL